MYFRVKIRKQCPPLLANILLNIVKYNSSKLFIISKKYKKYIIINSVTLFLV